MSVEEIEHLKKQRRYAKAAVTRQKNLLSQYVVEELPKESAETLVKMQEAFRNFHKVHDDYHEKLKIEDEIDASDAYFSEMQKVYIDMYRAAKDWLKTLESEQKPFAEKEADSDSNKGYSELLSLINMPKVEFEKFTGDPLKYHSFKALFEESVKVVDDKSVKLTRLLQCTSGKANDAISACVLMKVDEGYERAWKVLEDRFGNSYLVCERLIQNICQGKPIRNSEDLIRFADELNHCHVILESLGKLQEVESQRFIVEISGRFQNYLKRKWIDYARKIKDENDRYPSFVEFVKFVTKAANHEADPVYGSSNTRLSFASNAPSCGKSTSSASGKSKHAASFSVDSNNSDKKVQKCILCSGFHKLFWCKEFKDMKPCERLQFVDNQKLCHNCLLSNHTTANCRRPTVCTVPGCGKRHTKFLHISDRGSSDQSQSPNLGNLEMTNANVHLENNIFMPVVGVSVNGKADVSALLDTGSTNTFCTRTLIDYLGVKGSKTTYSLNTLNSSEKEVHSECVSLQLTSLDGSEVLNVSNVYVIDKIPVKSSCPDTKKFSHLSGLQFVAAEQDVHLLIGQDNSEALIPFEVRRGKRGEPFASRTKFGWSINGPSKVDGRIRNDVMSHFISSVEESLEDKVNKLWAIENDDVAPLSVSLSENDKKVLQLWKNELRLVDGHYEIPIPFKENAEFPNNFGMAVRRLNSLKSSLQRDGLQDKYTGEINKLFQKGYAELVPVESKESVENVWYLPHFAVLSDKKPDKLRIVFDCAAKYQGESLNDKCHQGPDENNRLIPVLLRFRENDYAITADIESMYYQVRVPIDQRNMLRFLWFNDADELVHCRMTCHVFGGIWCSSSTTFALRQTLTDFDASPLVATAVQRSFYVDDYLHSVAEADEVLNAALSIKSLIGKAGFNLTKFVISDPDIHDSIPADDRAKELKDLGPGSCSKVLGVKWDVCSDEFFFQVNVDPDMSVTRRTMLSTIASTFDPLGLVGPVIVQGKILFQEATRAKLSWDDPVPPDLKGKWLKWLRSLSEVINVRFPRCIKPGEFNDAALELHHFGDASERAYGCVSYLRCTNKHGDINTALLFSKSKVAPLKSVTIPRLELQAAVMSTQVDTMLRSQLDIELLDSYFWSDSELILKYISNEVRRFKAYVGNRVGAIRTVSTPAQWHHISGSDNPADVISRGGDIHALDKHNWLRGPHFLFTHKSLWQTTSIVNSLAPDDPEVKREVKTVLTSSVLLFEHPLDRLINYHSNWFKLKKAVAWLLRFRSILSKTSQPQTKCLSVSEMREAEMLILKHVQGQCYNDELVKLRKDGIVTKSSPLAQLSPLLNDHGIICVGGRLSRVSDDVVCKSPIVVPHSHKVAALIAGHYHSLAHLGTEWVVSLTRSQFWITKARSVVKKVGRACITCKKLFASPCSQKMADLPGDRVAPNRPPFSSTGIDCFGPFHIKVGRTGAKRYGCIFTCMSTRAIHLEKLNTLETDSFLNALRRFSCRRGQPHRIFCDNGTNFVGGRAELDKSLRDLDKDKISQFCLKENIEWFFNPPHASHMGGTWERMIRMVRKVMSGILSFGCRLTDEILETLFCEIEAIINSRPITKLSEDIKDPAPLTPNHLLLLRNGPVMPVGVFHNADLYKRRWRIVQFLADQFWHRWLKEYVPELQRRNKWLHAQPNLRVGDLVLICDENTPRGVWPMGLVVSVKTSDDGLVRSVVVKTKSSQFTRPISKCVLLEGCN